MNAAMDGRTNVEWDKDDLDALGILKIDVLGLGMLTCIRKAFALLERHHGAVLDLATVPPDDPRVYDMLCVADTVGVFQIESRAQMSMLPRLRPRNYYDLVIEVAIVRPGPIQGDMVHPYLRRRNGEERVSYPSKELARVLGKTLGVPLFQEQAMHVAMVAAGFTAEEADALRLAMATFRKTGLIHAFRGKMIDGMIARGYDPDFADRFFRQIEGFGDYGFLESHAASFALLVYVSAWLKCRYPAVFAAAILNSQPMGFYASAQLVRDAGEHGVVVRGIDVNASDWDNTLEPVTAEAAVSPASADPEIRAGAPAGGEAGPGGRRLALRLGFREIRGFKKEEAERLVAARGAGYTGVTQLWRRAGIRKSTLERLARADAFGSLGLARREALWAVAALGAAPLPLFTAAAPAGAPGDEDMHAASREAPVRLPAMTLGAAIVDDYAAFRLSLRAHPLALLRPALAAEGVSGNARLTALAQGAAITIAGLVLVRQRPGSAKGVIFATLEDETGTANVIIWPPVFERYRRIVMGPRLLGAAGSVQKKGRVIHVVARRLIDLSHRLDALGSLDASTGAPLAHAGEAMRPDRGVRSQVRIRSRDFH